MDLSKLKTMSVLELRALAKQLGVSIRGQAKAETIINLITAKFLTPDNTDLAKNLMPPAETPTPPVVTCTQEDVLKAIEPYANKDGFVVKFLDGGATWYFGYKGAEESGNMSIPLRVIKMKAESVSRGARALPKVNIDGEYIMRA